jgi:predicted nucleic acid-binding protein
VIPRIFVDANVLIAASGSRKGASRAILALAEIGMIQLVVSRQVLDEAERNIRLKLPGMLPIFAELLSYIPLQIVNDPVPEEFQQWLPIIEAKDAPILQAAVAASVTYFLTLNFKDFTPEVAAATGLTVQSPGEFVQNARAIFSQSM